MKLLLDECVVHDLKKDLVGHEVSTVVEAGFRGLENGELLRVAAAEYDVLITVDPNLPFQQNIASLPMAVLLLLGPGITYAVFNRLFHRFSRSFRRRVLERSIAF